MRTYVEGDGVEVDGLQAAALLGQRALGPRLLGHGGSDSAQQRRKLLLVGRLEAEHRRLGAHQQCLHLAAAAQPQQGAYEYKQMARALHVQECSCVLSQWTYTCLTLLRTDLCFFPVVALTNNDANNGLVQRHLRKPQLHHAVLRLGVLCERTKFRTPA